MVKPKNGDKNKKWKSRLPRNIYRFHFKIYVFAKPLDFPSGTVGYGTKQFEYPTCFKTPQEHVLLVQRLKQKARGTTLRYTRKNPSEAQ
jgi:hypothetical protein